MLNDGGLYLLHLRTVAWERVTTATAEPGALIARGGHTMTFVGATKLFIFGGGHMYNAIDNAVFNWHEADLATDARYGVGASNSVVLDTQDWSVSLAWAGRGFDAGTHGTSLKVTGDAPAPRGGHTATLVPHDGKLAILILGGRNYDEEGHAANPHLGATTRTCLCRVDRCSRPSPSGNNSITARNRSGRTSFRSRGRAPRPRRSAGR